MNGTSDNLIPLDDNTFIEAKALDVVEEIMARWPNLRVQYLNPDHFSDITDAPYRVIEFDKMNEPHVVLQVWEMDSSVITKLQAMSAQAMDLAKIVDEANAKMKAERDKAFRDEMDAKKDIALTAWKKAGSKFSYTDTDGTKKVFINDEHGRARVENVNDPL